MISVGKDSNGRPICKPLKPESYFPTYNDAYAALVEYNKNPYDLEPSITMKELYEKWLAEYEKTVKSIRSVASAWGYCSAVYDMRVKDVRARHVKGCMDEGISKVRGEEKTPSASMKNQIKSLFNLMLDYALEYELVDRNYSRTFNLSEETIKEIVTVKNEHIPFTDEEMDLLWKHADDKMLVDVLLIPVLFWLATPGTWFAGIKECGFGKLDFPRRYQNRCRYRSCGSNSFKDSSFGRTKIQRGSGTWKSVSAQLC